MELTFMEFIQGFTIPVIVCMVVGVVLLIVEMFIPGFGVTGVAGIGFLLLSIILRANTLAEALWMTVVVLIIVGILALLFLRSATKGAIAHSPLVLKDSLEKEEGFLSTEDMNFFVDKVGETRTNLRPAGIADFDGVKLDVVSEGEFIPDHTRVRVMRIEGRRILVRAEDDPAITG